MLELWNARSLIQHKDGRLALFMPSAVTWEIDPSAKREYRWSRPIPLFDSMVEGMEGFSVFAIDGGGYIHGFFLQDVRPAHFEGAWPERWHGQVKMFRQLRPGREWNDRHWSPIIEIGGHDIRQIIACKGVQGLIHVFALGGDGSLYVSTQTSSQPYLQQLAERPVYAPAPAPALTPPFSEWTGVGGFSLVQLAATPLADGRVHVFALDSEGDVQSFIPFAHSWLPPRSLGAHNMRLIDACLSKPGGRVLVCGVGGNGYIYVTIQNNEYDSANWRVLGGVSDVAQVAVGSNADGRFEVFVVTKTTGNVLHQWQDASGDWQGWVQMGDLTGVEWICVARDKLERLVVMAQTNSNPRTVASCRQIGANDRWEDWTTTFMLVKQPTIKGSPPKGPTLPSTGHLPGPWGIPPSSGGPPK